MSPRSLCSASLFASLLALTIAAGACGDNLANQRPDAGAPRPDAGPDAGSGSESEPAPGVGIAVVNSDFSSTSISLVDGATGDVTKGDCIDSGTTPPANSLALSSDVVLPSWPQPDHPLVVIDRGNGALTWIDPATCVPLRQLDVSTGFFANPHDLIGVSATKAYVTRYERNATPTPDPDDRDDGEDVLIIDPSIPAVTGRIDLSSYAVPVAGKAIQARPDRARLIDGKLYVVLANIAGDFKALSHGRVVVIDTATDQVTATVDIPDLINCSAPSYIAATKTLAVSCAGDFTTADPSTSSGIAYIDLAATPIAEIRHQAASAFGGRAIGAYSGIANDGTLGFAVTPGVFGAEPHDRLWSFSVASGQATKVTDAADSFILGTLLADSTHKRLYLTDALASTPRIHLYDYSTAPATLQTSHPTDAAHGLPPRELAWY
jgi:hypothetical protein